MPETRSPKPEDYIVVDGSDGPRRDFRISVGLREGWDAEGRVFDVSEAVRTARAWMRRRVEAGEPALSGMFTRAEVTYAWPREDGTVGSDREPVAVFTGEAVHAYLGHLPDLRSRRCSTNWPQHSAPRWGRSASMSPSPTGPGFWTRASTPAGRETSRERARAQHRRQSFAERFNGGLAHHAPEAKLKGLKRDAFD